MQLHDLRQLIINSEPEDWHEIPAGAFFTNAPNIDTGSFEQHDLLLVFRDDVDLTVQWGMRARGFDYTTSIKDLWPDAEFPDPSINVYHVDIFWRGVLVDRENLVSVDGGRAYLPLGSRRCTNLPALDEPRPTKAEYEYTASPWQTALARILESNRELDSYMARAHLTIRD